MRLLPAALRPILLGLVLISTVLTSSAITAAPVSAESALPAVDRPAKKGWPNARNTGIARCPDVKRKAPEGDQIVLDRDGQVLENIEFTDNVVIIVAADNVTIRCVKLNGGGYFGIDNTGDYSVRNTRVNKVEIDCKDQGSTIGLLLHHARVRRANVHRCNDMVMVGGDRLRIRESYCHDLTHYSSDFHGDCIQNLGGNRGLKIIGNSLWGWDTSNILLGQEYGEARDVVIRGNRLMAASDAPPPAYLLYLSGTNTVVKNNYFTTNFTYGHCTDNRADRGSRLTWENNRWWENGRLIRGC